MAHYTSPALVGPSKVVLWEETLGRLELGNLPFVVESFQIGSPEIRDNIKNRALADGVFDDTMYHGASAITLAVRLAPHLSRDSRATDYWLATLRDTLAAYMHPRLRPRLYWRYPGSGPTVCFEPEDFIKGFGTVAFGTGPFGLSTTLPLPPVVDQSDGAGQWAEVRGASWPFVVNGPKYPMLTVQFKNPLGQMFGGDPQAVPKTATAFPGAQADGRVYPTNYNVGRNYPNIAAPLGAALIHNDGNSYADWTLRVHGPFNAGAIVNLRGVAIQLTQALVINEYVEFRSLNKTILKNSGLSYYPHTNFGQWEWDDLLLPHGDVVMYFNGVNLGSPSGYATIEWYSTSI